MLYIFDYNSTLRRATLSPTQPSLPRVYCCLIHCIQRVLIYSVINLPSSAHNWSARELQLSLRDDEPFLTRFFFTRKKMFRILIEWKHVRWRRNFLIFTLRSLCTSCVFSSLAFGFFALYFRWFICRLITAQWEYVVPHMRQELFFHEQFQRRSLARLKLLHLLSSHANSTSP